MIMNTNKGETGKRNPPDAGCHTGRNIFQPVEWTSSPATLAPPPATARHRFGCGGISGMSLWDGVGSANLILLPIKKIASN